MTSWETWLTRQIDPRGSADSGAPNRPITAATADPRAGHEWLTAQLTPRPPKPRVSPARRAARRAAIERELTRSFRLSCGELTDRDEQALHPARGRKGVYYCTWHGEWFPPMPKPVREPLPDVPPF